MMLELEARGKAGLVDKIVFIGTPQLGTPKAIGTILHGYDQQKLGGYIIDDVVARDVIKNLPGAYSLLPSERYIAKSLKPLISFDTSNVTSQMRSQYGTTVDSFSEFVGFLNGTEGRQSVYDNISKPYIANTTMLQRAVLAHQSKLDSWQAPSGVALHNIIGVGLKTIDALEYREVTERTICSANIFGQITCNSPDKFIRPYAQFTQYGDETVTSISAEEGEGEKYYFDFVEYDEDTVSLFLESHADFIEVEEIQTLLANILTGATTTLEYTSATKPTFTRVYEVLAIDSPVLPLKTDTDGKRTGVIKVNDQITILEEIPDSEFLEFAGTKYIITPKDIDTTTTLRGIAHGSYTMTLATLSGSDEQTVQSRLVDATTTPSMVATFTNIAGAYSTVKTDLNGDGQIDAESTVNGEIISPAPVTFETLRQQINALNLSKQREKPLTVLVDVAQKLAVTTKHKTISRAVSRETLKALSTLLVQYERKGWITRQNLQLLQGTITSIRTTIN
jgi:hypothetical protein